MNVFKVDMEYTILVHVLKVPPLAPFLVRLELLSTVFLLQLLKIKHLNASIIDISFLKIPVIIIACQLYTLKLVLSLSEHCEFCPGKMRPSQLEISYLLTELLRRYARLKRVSKVWFKLINLVLLYYIILNAFEVVLE